MDLALTEEQTWLREAVDEMLARSAGDDGLVPASMGEAVWRELVEFGALEVGGDEGLGAVELALICWGLGGRLAAVPYVDSAALAYVAPGHGRAALGLSEPGRSFAPAEPSVLVRRRAHQRTRRARSRSPASVDGLAVTAAGPDGPVLALVAPSGARRLARAGADARSDAAAGARHLRRSGGRADRRRSARVGRRRRRRARRSRVSRSRGSRARPRVRVRGAAPPVRADDRQLPGDPPPARRHVREGGELVVERPLRGRRTRRARARQPAHRVDREGVRGTRDAGGRPRRAAGLRRHRLHGGASGAPLPAPHRRSGAASSARRASTSAASDTASPNDWRSRHEQRDVPPRVLRAARRRRGHRPDAGAGLHVLAALVDRRRRAGVRRRLRRVRRVPRAARPRRAAASHLPVAARRADGGRLRLDDASRRAARRRSCSRSN